MLVWIFWVLVLTWCRLLCTSETVRREAVQEADCRNRQGFLDQKMKSTFSMQGRCQDQNELEYVNPDGAADVLYIYPKDTA